jgi:hypothetical protein
LIIEIIASIAVIANLGTPIVVHVVASVNSMKLGMPIPDVERKLQNVWLEINAFTLAVSLETKR